LFYQYGNKLLYIVRQMQCEMLLWFFYKTHNF